MALPKIDLPTFKLYLNSLEREIVFRPFIVKEEKLLLLALEANDLNSVLEAIKQVINNCVLTEIDVDSLPLFEIEYIFLNLRARSMGEVVNLTYICGNELEDGKKCPTEMDVEVDMLKAALENKSQDPVIMLSENVGIKFKYPTIEVSRILNDENVSEMETTLHLIELCTDYLFDEEQVYKTTDMQPGEFEEFIGNLTQDQFSQMQKFFDGIPKIKYDTEVTCSGCGKRHNIHLEGILDFFE